MKPTNFNQSHKSADGDGCLKFCRPLEPIGIYTKFKTPHIYSIRMYGCNLRAESKACATDICYNIFADLLTWYSWSFRRKGPFWCLVGPRLGLHSRLLEYSYSSTDIVLNIIKILFLQKFEVYFGLFIYSLFISIRAHKSVFECKL